VPALHLISGDPDNPQAEAVYKLVGDAAQPVTLLGGAFFIP
jgi:hypothetical protein